MLVSCWLDVNNNPCAWISLDKNDNDLRLFLSYFLLAVQTMFPNVCRVTEILANALTLPPASILARSLINELGRIEQSFIMALDDFHTISDESLLDLVQP